MSDEHLDCDTKAQQSGGWRQFWKWFQITVVAPIFVYITIEALRMTYGQWFGPVARE